ncbi:MAG: diacylglycerol kinase [Demequinaceae bacterium]|nr:diacylglycerol kinase [Demequinaceae bacterium]
MNHGALTDLIAASALVIAAVGLSLAATITRRVGSRDPISVPPFWRRLLRIDVAPMSVDGDFGLTEKGTARIAFVANPTKAGLSDLREQAIRECSVRYATKPMWLFTTAEDAGRGAAQHALEAGADVVVAIGGDGTVRAVAEALAGTGVPLGIIPMGTGNIFARNMDLPLGDIPALLAIALDGRDAPTDVGRVILNRGPKGPDEEHMFLVMAGVGFDAEMVAGADERLKRRLGWLAYFFAAIKHLGSRRMSAAVSVDGSPEVAGQMRSVLFANVGKLPGGLILAPDANAEDGLLDAVTLDARAGIVGWTGLFGHVIAQGAGFRQPAVLKAYASSRIDHARGATMTVALDHLYKVQADGENLGLARKITATADRGVLLVRRPQI